MFELCHYRVMNFTSFGAPEPWEGLIMKIHIEFEWRWKLYWELARRLWCKLPEVNKSSMVGGGGRGLGGGGEGGGGTGNKMQRAVEDKHSCCLIFCRIHKTSLPQVPRPPFSGHMLAPETYLFRPLSSFRDTTSIFWKYLVFQHQCLPILTKFAAA